MIRTLFAIVLYTVPVEILQAQVTLTTILNMFILRMDNLVRVAIGVALIVFIWGLVRMLIAMNTGESDKAIADGKQKMIWGVVGLFLIVSIWGIVALLMTMFGVTGFPVGTPPIIT